MKRKNTWKRGARIAKQFNFSASHQLTGVPDDHPCARLHGHNYMVEVEVRGDVNPHTGFVVDFQIIDNAIKPLIEKLDHYHLNDIIENPTAENIAQWIMDNHRPHFAFSVKVWETPKCWAKVLNPDGFWRIRDEQE